MEISNEAPNLADPISMAIDERQAGNGIGVERDADGCTLNVLYRYPGRSDCWPSANLRGRVRGSGEVTEELPQDIEITKSELRNPITFLIRGVK